MVAVRTDRHGLAVGRPRRAARPLDGGGAHVDRHALALGRGKRRAARALDGSGAHVDRHGHALDHEPLRAARSRSSGGVHASHLEHHVDHLVCQSDISLILCARSPMTLRQLVHCSRRCSERQLPSPPYVSQDECVLYMHFATTSSFHQI